MDTMDIIKDVLTKCIAGDVFSINKIEHQIKSYYVALSKHSNKRKHNKLCNKFKEIIDYIKNSLRINHENPNVLYLLGVIAEQEKNIDEAIAIYQQAISYSNINSIFKLARIYANQNEHVKAFELYRSAKKNSKCSYQLAIRYSKGIGCEQNIQKAIKYYKRSVKIGNASAAYELGELYKASGDKTKAIKWYLQASDIYYPTEKDDILDLIQYSRSLTSKNKDLEKELEDVKKQNKTLQDKVHRQKQKLLYTPGAKGFYETKHDFEKLVTNSVTNV